MNIAENFHTLHERVRVAGERAGRDVRLLAVSKTCPAAQIRTLAQCGQRAFAENYVQEALAKQAELTDLDVEWHAIGPLQSNKAREVALHFDWLQSLDRLKLVTALNHFRPADATPLNVLIQVNIDAEPSKSGCTPEAIDALAEAVLASPRLRLRGLMAVPEPHRDMTARRKAFARMNRLYDELRAVVAQLDTLSMGMSDDFELAIDEGATMVRIGSALFGRRA